MMSVYSRVIFWWRVWTSAGTVSRSIPSLWRGVGSTIVTSSSTSGVVWAPLLLTFGVAAAGAALSVARALRGARAATFPGIPRARHLRLRLVTAWLHLVQPLARLRGRLDGGLTPWRRRAAGTPAWPRRHTWTLWTERRREPQEWLSALHERLRGEGYVVERGGAWDTWDLQVRAGSLGVTRLLTTYEEHGRRRQLVRLRAWPQALPAAWLTGGLIALAALAAVAGGGVAAIILAILAGAVAIRAVADCAGATGAVRAVFEQMARESLPMDTDAAEPVDATEKVA